MEFGTVRIRKEPRDNPVSVIGRACPRCILIELGVIRIAHKTPQLIGNRVRIILKRLEEDLLVTSCERERVGLQDIIRLLRHRDPEAIVTVSRVPSWQRVVIGHRVDFGQPDRLPDRADRVETGAES
ncbi:MAG: hypothetical protein EB020_12625, partial [Proteobacteria bacterium]|nr:hypothetical protein [Pseudomonadota bacterium]